jgi:cell wall-associated NlpC family hydrolase
MNRFTQNVLIAAKKQANAKYREGANNDSYFGRWYGLNHQPWCAMFVSWCFAQAGVSRLVAASTPKGFASCAAGMSWFKSNGQIVNPKQAQPGDIVFFQFDHDSEPDHVGIVVSVDAGGLHTVEGNTSLSASGPQRNGDGVCYKYRTWPLVMAVVRPKWPGN